MPARGGRSATFPGHRATADPADRLADKTESAVPLSPTLVLASLLPSPLPSRRPLCPEPSPPQMSVSNRRRDATVTA